MPSVHSQFGIDYLSSGLADYLDASRGGDGEPIKTDVENLWVLPAGVASNNASELLCTPKLTELVAELRDEFDYVIIDTPPVGEMSDALLISKS